MVSYDFYRNTFQGEAINPDDWFVLEARASDQLNRYKRIYTITVPADCPDGEKLAVCAMADALAYFVAAQNGTGGAVSSASIGSVSVSYGGSAPDLSLKSQARELYRCACQYLDIYRGVDGC